MTRYVYDGQGLLRYAVDGLNQVIAYGYDAAGLQTSVLRYAAAMAATTAAVAFSAGLGAHAGAPVYSPWANAPYAWTLIPLRTQCSTVPCGKL